MNMQKMAAAVLAGCLAVSLAGCSRSAASESTAPTVATTETATEPTAAVTGFTVQLGPDPETLDPALNSTVDGANILITVFEPLLILDEDNSVQPGQAADYTVSEDGLTWTFTLRDGLKWSDGSDLTAQDFEYSFKRLADPNTAAPYAESALGMIAGFDEARGNPDADGNPTTDPDPDALQVTASEDGKTLTIVLSYPCSYFDRVVAMAALSPVQQATVEANGDAWCTSPDTFVSNGPYMVSQWTPGDRLVLARNPNYVGGWDSGRIVSDTITLLLTEDADTAYAAYNSGDVQLARSVPLDEIPSLTRAEDGGDFYLESVLGTCYLSFNTQREPFNDPRVRQALSLAIDRSNLADTVLQGTYSPAYNLVGPGLEDAEEGSSFHDNANGGESYISQDYQANLEQAKALLAEAGYPDGEGFPTITYTTNEGGYSLPLAQYLQSVWGEELGIQVELEEVPWSSLTPQRRAGDFDICRNGWLMDYNDPTSLLETFTSTNGNNDGRYSSSAFDAAIQASRSDDPATHYDALHQAEDLLMEDMACIPLAYYNDFWLQSPSLKGTWHSPNGLWYLQYGYLES